MDAFSKVLFVAVALSLLTRGIRNVLWSEANEKRRFLLLVSHGLEKPMTRSGIVSVLFGGMLAYAARSVPM